MAKAFRATELNIWVMGQVMAANGGRIPLRVEATHAPHLKRCLKAGLIEQSADKSCLVPTQAGLEALSR